MPAVPYISISTASTNIYASFIVRSILRPKTDNVYVLNSTAAFCGNAMLTIIAIIKPDNVSSSFSAK